VFPPYKQVESNPSLSLLETDSSSIGGVIGAYDILHLPLNGGLFETLVQLFPGAVLPAAGSHLSARGGFNIAGVDEHYNSSLLDGTDNIDPIIRNFSFRPSIDAIQEFQILERGYNAEFGRNAGAVINIITKSGTNAFHGSFWELFRNDSLDAHNYFSAPGTGKPPLIRNQFGMTVGGPLKRDKTFFFAEFEGLRQKAGAVHRATVPTPSLSPENSGLPPEHDGQHAANPPTELPLYDTSIPGISRSIENPLSICGRPRLNVLSFARMVSAK
jgi:hypothetical protein